MKALIKECRGLAACVSELHRTRHKLMQAIRGEEVRAITKVSAHRLPKKGRRKETVHTNIRQYTFSQDSQQLHQARHSVWMDNHVITSAPSTQHTEPRRPEPRQVAASRTRTRKVPVTRKRGRARPQTISQSAGSSTHPFMHNDDIEVGTLSPLAGGGPPIISPRRSKTTKRPRERPESLSQSTGSTAHPFMHNEDMDTDLGGTAPLLHTVNTDVYSAVDNTMITDDATIDILAGDGNTIDDDMDTDIIVDAVHVYIHRIFGSSVFSRSFSKKL